MFWWEKNKHHTFFRYHLAFSSTCELLLLIIIIKENWPFVLNPLAPTNIVFNCWFQCLHKLLMCPQMRVVIFADQLKSSWPLIHFTLNCHYFVSVTHWPVRRGQSVINVNDRQSLVASNCVHSCWGVKEGAKSGQSTTCHRDRSPDICTDQRRL